MSGRAELGRLRRLSRWSTTEFGLRYGIMAIFGAPDLRYPTVALTATTQSVLEAAMALPEDQRVELAIILLDSIGDDRPDTEIDAAWLVEAKRRLDAVRSGHSSTLIPTEVVEHELEELILDAAATRRAG